MNASTGQDAIDPHLGSVPPVLTEIAADRPPGDEGPFPGPTHCYHLLFRREIAEVDPIGIGSGEGLKELVGIVLLLNWFANLFIRYWQQSN
jgi:hypothetical protein